MLWRQKCCSNFKMDRLYNKYNKLMFEEAKSILRDKQLAEDAVQETFARLMAGRYDIIEDGREKGYLVKACRNVCFDVINKRSKLSADVELSDDILDYSKLVQNMPLDFLMCEELREAIMNIIQTMDEKYKDVITFKLVFDMPIKKIAALCGISEGNVRTRLSRAKAKLYEELIKEGWINEKPKSKK